MRPRVSSAPATRTVTPSVPQTILSKTMPIHDNTPLVSVQPSFNSTPRTPITPKPLTQKTTKTSISSRRPVLLFGILAIIGFVATAYVGIDVWRTNQAVKQELVAATDQTTQTDGGDIDETPLAEDALANYAVAPNMPRAIYINKLELAARVLPVAVNSDGSMQSPFNIHDAGWYSPGVKPGEPGAAVINAHSSGRTKLALFSDLGELRNGDEIMIERGDKTMLHYKVTHVTSVPLSEIDMNEFMRPYDGAGEGLNLMTCSGSYVRESDTYDHRTIVYATRV